MPENKKVNVKKKVKSKISKKHAVNKLIISKINYYITIVENTKIIAMTLLNLKAY